MLTPPKTRSLRLVIRKSLNLGQRSASAALLAWLIVTTVFWPASGALANPQNGRVVSGHADIQETSPTRLDVFQSTEKAVIHWESFDIAVGEHTNFDQPSGSSITLNKIPNSMKASEIFGRLTANGRLWVQNARGVLVGKDAQIDVNGLLLTTADIYDADFMAGKYEFRSPGDANGFVINEGTITIRDGGMAALVAPWVENRGVIHARLGKVELAAGETFTLDFYGDQLIEFGVSAEAARVLASNSGAIEADGGTVALSTAATGAALESVINMDGVVRARSVQSIAGRIVLDGGDVEVAGTLDASGRGQGESGGTVSVMGDQVTIAEAAGLDASGDAGGGTLLVGGELQGSGERSAEATSVAEGARLQADAITEGDGGTVIVWADDETVFEGSASARGGRQGGDGGFAEISGARTLRVRGEVDLSADEGEVGTLLLDPESFVIDNSETATITSNDISRALREDQANFVLNAESVEIADQIDGRGGSAALVIDAGGDVTLNDDILNGGTIRIDGDGGIEMTDGNPDSFVTQGNGTVLFSENGEIDLLAAEDVRLQYALAPNGQVLARSFDGDVEVARLVDTRSGDAGAPSQGRVELLADGAIDVRGAIATDDGGIVVDAGSTVSMDSGAVIFSGGGSVEISGGSHVDVTDIGAGDTVAIDSEGTARIRGVVENRTTTGIDVRGADVEILSGGRLVVPDGAITIDATTGSIAMDAGNPLSTDPNLRDTGIDAGNGTATLAAADAIELEYVNAAGGIDATARGGDILVAGRVDGRLDAQNPALGGGTIALTGQARASRSRARSPPAMPSSSPRPFATWRSHRRARFARRQRRVASPSRPHGTSC